MNRRRSIEIAVLCTIMLALTGFILRNSYSVRVAPLEWRSSTGAAGTFAGLSFSTYDPAEAASVISYRIVVETGHTQRLKIKLVPDDRLLTLRVNGSLFDLSNFSSRALSDYQEGIEFFLPGQPAGGRYILEAVIQNTGGPFGIRFAVAGGGAILIICKGLLALLLLLLTYRLCRALDWSTTVTIACVSGVALRIGSLWVTDPTERGHDLAWHLDYIQKFVSLDWPSVVSLWAQHPPTYYSLACILRSLLILLGCLTNEALLGILQSFSLLCSCLSLGFVVDTLVVLQRALGRRKESAFGKTSRHLLTIVACAAAVWPSYIVHAPRIGNECVAYLFCAIACRFWLSWHFFQSTRALGGFVIAVSLASISKYFGLILFWSFFVVEFLWQCTTTSAKSRPWRLSKAHALKILALAIVMAGVALGPALFFFCTGSRENLFIGDENLVSSALRVENLASNFLWFDLKTFITVPFISPWRDETGRQYFLNYLGKTALFGEFSFSAIPLINLATIISWSWVLLVAMCVGHLLTVRSLEFVAYAPIYIGVLASLAAITFIRVICPVNIDFRYIAFAQPLMLGFVTLTLEQSTLFVTKRVKLLASILLGVFVVASLLFDIYFIYFEW